MKQQAATTLRASKNKTAPVWCYHHVFLWMSPRFRFNNNLMSVFQQERLWRATSTALTRTHVVPVVRCRAPSSLHHGLFIEQRRTVRCVILASQPTYRQRGNGERGSSGNNKSPVGIQRGSSMKQHFLSMACHSSSLDWLKHEPSRVSMTTCGWLTRRVQDEWMWSGKLIKDKSRAGNVEGNFKQHAQKSLEDVQSRNIFRPDRKVSSSIFMCWRWSPSSGSASSHHSWYL